jgi:phage head maturation protease
MNKSPILVIKGKIHPSSPYESRSERPAFPTKHALKDFANSKNFKISLRSQHDPQKVVGWIDKFHIDEEGNLCSDRIFVTDEETSKLVKNGTLHSMSVGMVHHKPELDEYGAIKQFNDTCFYEVSLVDDPAFPECKIEGWKDMNGKREGREIN